MGKIPDGADFDHPRPAFKGVQVAQQVFVFNGVLRLGLPTHQGRTGAFQQVKRLFQKDIQQLRVDAVLRPGRRCRWRGVTRLYRGRAAVPKGTNGLDQFSGFVQRRVVTQLFEHHQQLRMAEFQQARQRRALAQAAVQQPFV